MTPDVRKPFNPWPYAIMGFFAVAIVAAVGWVVFCIGHGTDLVAADYYEQEVEYQRQLDRMERGLGLMERARLAYEPATASILIQLPPEHGKLKPRGLIQLYRASEAGLDQTLPLGVAADGAQHLDASQLAPGLWDVRVRWEADGEEYFLSEKLHITGNRS